MPISRDFPDLRISGVYLAPVLTLWLFWKTDIAVFAIIGVGGLLGAVAGHGVVRKTFGLGGPEENPKKREDAFRGMICTVLGIPRERIPDQGIIGQSRWILRTPQSVSHRSGTVILTIALLAFWTISIFVSLYGLIYHFGEITQTIGLLYLAFLIWISQWLLWRLYTPNYLLDNAGKADFDE